MSEKSKHQKKGDDLANAHQDAKHANRKRR